VTSEATPVVLRHGQPVGRIRYEVMAGAPDRLYDDTKTSNYTGQTAAQLGKYFTV
jgi:deoxycytidine triphosphate deaminase